MIEGLQCLRSLLKVALVRHRAGHPDKYNKRPIHKQRHNYSALAGSHRARVRSSKNGPCPSDTSPYSDHDLRYTHLSSTTFPSTRSPLVLSVMPLCPTKRPRRGFDPQRDVEDLTGKVIIVTGGK